MYQGVVTKKQIQKMWVLCHTKTSLISQPYECVQTLDKTKTVVYWFLKIITTNAIIPQTKLPWNWISLTIIVSFNLEPNCRTTLKFRVSLALPCYFCSNPWYCAMFFCAVLDTPSSLSWYPPSLVVGKLGCGAASSQPLFLLVSTASWTS